MLRQLPVARVGGNGSEGRVRLHEPKQSVGGSRPYGQRWRPVPRSSAKHSRLEAATERLTAILRKQNRNDKVTTLEAIKERPILFSAPMVLALLEGRKTMTRRVVKFNHKPWLEPLPHVEYARDGMPIWWGSPPSDEIRQSDYYDKGYPCPYGQPGERLWVRETFRIESFGADVAQIRYVADGKRGKNSGVSDRKLPNRLGTVVSIHMPRQCSRITLEITGVRCERLHEITEADAAAEGCTGTVWGPAWQGYRSNGDDLNHCQTFGDSPPDWMVDPKPYDMSMLNKTARQEFETLWRVINGSDSWEANPWVWVVEFKRIEPTTDSNSGSMTT